MSSEVRGYDGGKPRIGPDSPRQTKSAAKSATKYDQLVQPADRSSRMFPELYSSAATLMNIYNLTSDLESGSKVSVDIVDSRGFDSPNSRIRDDWRFKHYLHRTIICAIHHSDLLNHLLMNSCRLGFSQINDELALSMRKGVFPFFGHFSFRRISR